MRIKLFCYNVLFTTKSGRKIICQSAYNYTIKVNKTIICNGCGMVYYGK